MSDLNHLDPLYDPAVEQLSVLMREIEQHLVDGYTSGAADGLVDLARYYAKAGLDKKVFADMRRHIVESAKRRAGCPIFIEYALQSAERELSKKRIMH